VAKGDLDWAVAKVGPKASHPPSIFENPKVAKRLGQILERRAAEGWSLTYMARLLTELARWDGVLGPDVAITDTNLGRWLRLRRAR
jgi:hypothetical protein